MTTSIKITALTDLHRENGAKLVEFAGYEMPIQYPLGIVKEHLHTREKAGLFDVSHMGQARVVGPNAALELEALIPIDIVDLADGEQRYGFFTNPEGGIEDDLMVSRWGDVIHVVVNAACKDADFAHLQKHLTTSELQIRDDRALIALQGPTAKDVMSRLGQELDDFLFMQCQQFEIGGIDCEMSRSGYSGEDGFEISVDNQDAVALARLLQADADTEWVGLGARDTLRLEGGLCLYGHDIDSTTTPVEAALTWAISPARRADGERAGGFPGAAYILAQMPAKITRKRVGLKPSGRAPIRDDTPLLDSEGAVIGKVSSGGFSPSLGHPIAMGYVDKSYSRRDTVVYADVRQKSVELTVCNPTFVPNRFYRG